MCVCVGKGKFVHMIYTGQWKRVKLTVSTIFFVERELFWIISDAEFLQQNLHQLMGKKGKSANQSPPYTIYS